MPQPIRYLPANYKYINIAVDFLLDPRVSGQYIVSANLIGNRHVDYRNFKGIYQTSELSTTKIIQFTDNFVQLDYNDDFLRSKFKMVLFTLFRIKTDSFFNKLEVKGFFV